MLPIASMLLKFKTKSNLKILMGEKNNLIRRSWWGTCLKLEFEDSKDFNKKTHPNIKFKDFEGKEHSQT